MESSARERIMAVLLGATDAEIQKAFVGQYAEPLDDFVAHMATAYNTWQRLDSRVAGSEERAHVSSLVFGVINNIVISMKLLLLGLPVAAGSAHRQVLEGMALALLTSRRDLGIRQRYMEGKFSTHKSIVHLRRHASKLGVDPKALGQLEWWNKFRDQFSHPTHMTIAHSIFLNPPGPAVIGGFFDTGKSMIYEKEVRSLASLASILCNFIEAVEDNLAEDIDEPPTP